MAVPDGEGGEEAEGRGVGVLVAESVPAGDADEELPGVALWEPAEEAVREAAGVVLAEPAADTDAPAEADCELDAVPLVVPPLVADPVALAAPEAVAAPLADAVGETPEADAVPLPDCGALADTEPLGEGVAVGVVVTLAPLWVPEAEAAAEGLVSPVVELLGLAELGKVAAPLADRDWVPPEDEDAVEVRDNTGLPDAALVAEGVIVGVAVALATLAVPDADAAAEGLSDPVADALRVGAWDAVSVGKAVPEALRALDPEAPEEGERVAEVEAPADEDADVERDWVAVPPGEGEMVELPVAAPLPDGDAGGVVD